MSRAVSIVKRLALAGVATFGVQIAAALLWPTPRHQDHYDPTGWFGPTTEPPLRVAGLGDSTCHAPGLQSADDIWIRVVANRIASETARPVDLRSFAVGGSTAASVVSDQLDAAIEFRPHLAFVSVGANDVIRGVPMSKFATHLDEIVGRLTATGALVITSGVGDLGTIPRLAPPLRHVVTRLGRRADRVHTIVTDRHGAIKSNQWDWAKHQFRTRSDVWSPDRFHPNAAGHLVWADTAWRSVRPILSQLARA